MDELFFYVAYAELADTQSIEKAAEKLDCTAREIKKAVEHYAPKRHGNIAFFADYPNDLTLTDFGKEFAEPCYRIRATLMEAAKLFGDEI